MNTLHIYLTLFQHSRLSQKRGFTIPENKLAYALVAVFLVIMATYFMAGAIVMSLVANQSKCFSPFEFFFLMLPFMLVVDFISRFYMQKTPAQQVRPYSLLPWSKYACVDFFVLRSLFRTGTFVWTLFAACYALMTMLFREGFWASFYFVLLSMIVFCLNGWLYVLLRTLINRNIAFWLLAIIIYALPFVPLMLGTYHGFMVFHGTVGAAFEHFSPMALLSLALFACLLFKVNQRVQYHFMYLEQAEAKERRLRSVTRLTLLDSCGEVGEYIKLEVKSIMRNKTMRMRFILSIGFVMVMSLFLAFSSIYEDGFSQVFWVVYNFVVYGSLGLVQVMCQEGNYIDCLMSHKENIASLLRAKYYFYSATTIFPFVLMLPTVIWGGYSLLTLLTMQVFTVGAVYCALMQMAVYNNSTLPLNTKLTVRKQQKQNYVQSVVEIVILLAPVVLLKLTIALFGNVTANFVLMAIGVPFIVCHKRWIRNVYKRMMRRRYQNMEAFRATR